MSLLRKRCTPENLAAIDFLQSGINQNPYTHGTTTRAAYDEAFQVARERYRNIQPPPMPTARPRSKRNA